MSWFHNGYTDICVMGFSHGLIQPLLAHCIDVHLTWAVKSISPFSLSGALAEVSFKGMNWILCWFKPIILSEKNCLICRFVLYDVNVPQELFRSFFFWVSVGLGEGRVLLGEGRRSALKSEPCKSNQLYSFSDKMLVNQNTFSKSHSIMRNLNWKQKPFVYYKCQGEVVTCHP